MPLFLAPIAAKVLLRFPVLGKVPWRLVGYVLAVLAVVGTIWWGYHRIYTSGYEAAERDVMAKWDNQKQLDAAAAQRLSEKWAHAQTVAADERAKRDAAVTKKLAEINSKVNQYAQTPAGRTVCLDDDGMQLANAAIDAANASISAR